MLYALAIYEINPITFNHSKIKAAPLSNHTSRLFKGSNNDDLQYLEQGLLKDFSLSVDNGCIYKARYKDKDTDEFHYLKKHGNYLLAIVSRKSLEQSELFYLFANMAHAQQSPKTVTLQNIIQNPCGYTGTDCLLGRVQVQVTTVIDTMKSNITQARANLHLAHELLEKTDVLLSTADDFEREARKTNKCCKM